MILAVRADRVSFKTVKFTAGFNVILADRTKDSTKRDTRNGLGKSTLIEIIHFCLGGGATAGKGIMVERLHDWTFFLDLLLHGKQITVARSTATAKKVTISGDTTGWVIQPQADRKTGEPTLSIPEWNTVLGHLMFGLSSFETAKKYSPTFRSLISYIIRRGPDAYTVPFEHFRKQNEWDKQVNNAFLLDLAWEDGSAWQELRDRKKIVEELQKAAKAGMLDELVGTIGELESQKVLLDRRANQERTDLRTFKVHERYHEIEQRANTLTSEIHGLVNENVADRQLIAYYERSLKEEREPTSSDLFEVYDEAEVVLGESVRKRLDEVEAFHKQLLLNRRVFLASEVDQLRRKVEVRERTIEQDTAARSELMQVLSTHRALEEHTQLERLYLGTLAELKDVVTRIDRLRQFEEGRSKLRIDQEMLTQRARRDYMDRRPRWEPAVSIFNSLSEALYKSPGRLVVDVGPTGFKFNVEIVRSSSEGITSMKVFCYDLTLAKLWADREPSPRLLMHDSTIFDPVDTRQRAVALELAQRESDESGFQYICTINSDMVPRDEFSDGFRFESFVRLILTDATDDGGLLGIRY